jgi:hypothetical protein
MESGTGNAPGFQERGDTVYRGNCNHGDDYRQPARAQSGVVPQGARADDHCNRKENKAQNLMPERMNRLYSGGNHVLYKLPRLPRQILLRHDFIVSKGRLVPAHSRLYNQGNIRCSAQMGKTGHGTDGPVVASQ